MEFTKILQQTISKIDIKSAKKAPVPDDMICPILYTIMLGPVRIHGHYYELTAIESLEWHISDDGTYRYKIDPLTRKLIYEEDIKIDHVKSSEIYEFLMINKLTLFNPLENYIETDAYDYMLNPIGYLLNTNLKGATINDIFPKIVFALEALRCIMKDPAKTDAKILLSYYKKIIRIARIFYIGSAKYLIDEPIFIDYFECNTECINAAIIMTGRVDKIHRIKDIECFENADILSAAMLIYPNNDIFIEKIIKRQYEPYYDVIPVNHVNKDNHNKSYNRLDLAMQFNCTYGVTYFAKQATEEDYINAIELRKFHYFDIMAEACAPEYSEDLFVTMIRYQFNRFHLFPKQKVIDAVSDGRNNKLFMKYNTELFHSKIIEEYGLLWDDNLSDTVGYIDNPYEDE